MLLLKKEGNCETTNEAHLQNYGKLNFPRKLWCLQKNPSEKLNIDMSKHTCSILVDYTVHFSTNTKIFHHYSFLDKFQTGPCLKINLDWLVQPLAKH